MKEVAKLTRREQLVLVDAHSLIYRAFFALPPMSTSRGLVTNAAYGFTSMLALVLAARPRYAVAAFDTGRPTFRSAEFAGYKGGRRPMPDDLRPQFDLVKSILAALRIPIHAVEGFEADDLIGTLSAQAERAGLAVTIVSGDLDCLQLVSEATSALVPRRGVSETTLYGPDQVRQRYGLEPAQLIDFKALRGDTSDSIPGIPGVGDKTAAELVRRFGSAESILAGLAELKEGRVRSALAANSESLLLAKRLVTIRRDVPIELHLEEAGWLHYDREAAQRVFDELEFRQLLARFPVPDQVASQSLLDLTPEPPLSAVRPVDLETVGALQAELSAQGRAALVGLWEGPARTASPAGFGVATAAGAWYVPTPMLAQLKAALPSVSLLAHDVKETQVVLGGDNHWEFSTHLAAYLLGQGTRDPRLEDLAREKLGLQLRSWEQLTGPKRSALPLSELAAAALADFAASQASAILRLGPLLEAEMRNLGVDYLFHEIELPLAAVLAEMEAAGVAVDVDYLREMGTELGAQLADLESRAWALAGYEFNLNAPQQLAKLLFEDLALPVGKRTKTGFSTDADTLEGLRGQHLVVELILEHRQLSKLKSTYVDALPLLVDGATGRVHTSFGQASTATGRLSSSNPNLMNIPIRTEMGQRIRRAFKAGWAGHILFSADYSQIELRVAAHLSEDEQLLAAFAAGHDIHAATAARVFGTEIGAVSADQRRLAKIANFGSLYGQGEYGLAQQMGIPGDQARQFLSEYWSNYAGLKEWLDGVRATARETGVVVSATGRRRAIPDLRSPNYQLRQGAERMAINFPIQSLAADIIKIAMVNLDREMADRALRGRMLLQVHDELVFELPAEELTVFQELVPRLMTEAYELLPGLQVEAKAGANWADMTRVV
ncbi:MAG: DNA polymerase I [Candidatus Dormibacteraceae bacterium]